MNLEVIRAKKIVYPKMTELFFFPLNLLPSLLSLFHLLAHLAAHLAGHLVRWRVWEEGVVVKHGEMRSDPIAQGWDGWPHSNGGWRDGGWAGALDGEGLLVLVGR